MQELEKILEEIESEIAGSMGRKREGLLLADKIIRKHLSRENEPEIERYSRDNDGWIPVEERLPEGRTRVICQFDNGDIEMLRQDWESDPESLTYWTYFDYMAEKKVIAWRPLPEPYRPERSEEE